MPLQQQLDETYLGTAILHSRMSKAVRMKVGACMITKMGIIIPGYNGTPVGQSNVCEDIDQETGELVTKDMVIHAELNCVLKAAQEGVSCKDATVYVTLAPCERCAAMLLQVGIKRLVYLDTYRSTKGIELLQSSGVNVQRFITERK